MERRGSKARETLNSQADDDLGQMIRWSVRDSIGGVEPPADVWPEVLERLRAGPAEQPLTPSLRRAAFPLAPFVQAVVISALLLAFGLGVDRSVVLPRQEALSVSTPVVRGTRAVVDTTDDMPSGYMGYMLARSEHQVPVRRGGNIE
jgi:hypothetical protein